MLSLTQGSALLCTALALFVPSCAAASNSTNTTTSSIETNALLSSGTVTLDNKWTTAYTKAKALVTALTNDEKISIITGGSVSSSSANFTALKFKDGDQGPIAYYQASGFGEVSALVMTWDRTAIYNQMNAVGKEFYGKGFQVINGPTSQPLGRSPWGGRLVETLGQDTYLNSAAFGLAVKGFGDAGVVPGGKHFLLNEQETNRSVAYSPSGDTTEPYSSDADDKTTHETYLFPFYEAVKNGMGAVMCAMNKVNQTQSCENSQLLNKWLKTELGFPGIVYPDVGGQVTSFGSANGGEDYGSSSYWSDTIIAEGISNGSMTQARLDDMAERNLIAYYYYDLDNGEQPSISYATTIGRDVRTNHSSIIRENGANSIALLKNVNNALPLKAPNSMALFGVSAAGAIGGPGIGFSTDGTDNVYQGHLAGGSGSGTTTFPYLVAPKDALLTRAIADGTMIRWVTNDTYSSSSTSTGGGGGGGSGGGMGGSGGNSTLMSRQNFDSTSDDCISQGCGTNISPGFSNYASDMEVCLVFLNAYSGEGADRTALRDEDQDLMVNTVAATCNNTIVVINTVGARLVDQWIENDNVTALVYGGLLGQNSGLSIADVLYGDVNPSGRLVYTIAKNESDYSVPICETATCNFTEGNYIDYKYFDKYNVTPRYEFGFGLSYTTFEYADLVIDQVTEINSTYASGTLMVGGREDLWTDVLNITATISNTGDVAGQEVAQLYIAFPDEADAPVRSLRGFDKVMIESGASEQVSFTVKRRDISYWDVTAQEWAVAAGTYNFTVGASSRDLRLAQTFEFTI